VSDRDESVERVVRALKRPVPSSPDLDARIMARVLAERRPAPSRVIWPLAALAAAAGLAAVAVFGVGARGKPVAFTLVAPRASSVAIVGDFNDWNPRATPLVRTGGGAWETRVRLAPGQYNYAFVVDGSTWVPDPAAPRNAADDFGSPNSVVTVAGASL